MKEPLLSIVIPIYNAKDCIDKIMKNIEEQQCKNIEIILINDGSTDGSKEICAKYIEKENVIVINQINKGVSAARNSGIQEAKGKYITFLDVDDTIENMKDIYQSLQKNEDDLIIFGIYFDYYKNDKLIKTVCKTFPDKKITNKQELEKYFFELYKENYITPVWNKIFKLEVLKNNNIKFNEEMVLFEDLEFSLRVLENVKNINIDSHIYYHYYIEKTVNPLKRRKEINYYRNFDILRDTLLEFAQKYNFSKESIKKIKQMIFRFYYCILKRETLNTTTLKEDLKKIKKFVEYDTIQDITKEIEVNGKKERIIQFLIRKKKIRSLYLYMKLINNVGG